MSSPRKHITLDDLYRRSSQYMKWSFLESEIQEKRRIVNQQGVSSTKERIANLPATTPEVEILQKYGGIEFLTPHEEAQAVSYFAKKSQDIAGFFKFQSQVRSTAISYLKRFYLLHSVMEYHPKTIMLTCLFLAAKVENSFIGIKSFSHPIPKTTPEAILEYEFLVIQTMEFTLMCHHGFKPLYGFFLDVQSFLPKLDNSRLGTSYDKAKRLLNDVVLSDAPFHFTPPQLALMCLWVSDAELTEKYLAKKFGCKRSGMETIQEESASVEPQDAGNQDMPSTGERRMTANEHFEKILDIIKQCHEKFEKTFYSPSVEEIKSIERKIHYCNDPMKYIKKQIKVEQGSLKRSASPVDEDAKKIKTE